MTQTLKKVVILSLEERGIQESTKLLEANGFEVEIRQPRKREWLTYSHSGMGGEREREQAVVERACLFLLSHLSDKFTLDGIAQEVGSNRSQLAAYFKGCLNTGVFEWLRKQRMLTAKTLLIESNLTVQQIGFEVGYENQANFASAYKKQFNLSPTAQRLLANQNILTPSIIEFT
ncbi:MAG: hypothetical protein CL586_05990 [Alteromonadaceae bacterium]|nr:hypothetical protein [Alteromonadaceae bacterium]HCV04132.1 hypothetical protein [Pseudoalteromonas sp.]|tara:strand:- start:3087 stop:3611 length:525 start_codon:yes stop_codon:yes gene_type:complete